MLVNKLKALRDGGEEEGFTLIELMIVVVIIGILAAIAIPIFANQQKSAISAGMKSDVKNTNTNIATALVKAPTAATIAGTATGNSGTFTLAGGATGAIVVSDSGTTVKVGGAITGTGATAAQAASGKWDNYSIVATNTAADPEKVIYTSVDGKLS